jgi:hypothetical protein
MYVVVIKIDEEENGGKGNERREERNNNTGSTVLRKEDVESCIAQPDSQIVRCSGNQTVRQSDNQKIRQSDGLTEVLMRKPPGHGSLHNPDTHTRSTDRLQLSPTTRLLGYYCLSTVSRLLGASKESYFGHPK